MKTQGEHSRPHTKREALGGTLPCPWPHLRHRPPAPGMVNPLCKPICGAVLRLPEQTHTEVVGPGSKERSSRPQITVCTKPSHNRETPWSRRTWPAPCSLCIMGSVPSLGTPPGENLRATGLINAQDESWWLSKVTHCLRKDSRCPQGPRGRGKSERPSRRAWGPVPQKGGTYPLCEFIVCFGD